MLPKKTGKTNIEMFFKDTETEELVVKYIYQVLVGDDLKVTCKLIKKIIININML